MDMDESEPKMCSDSENESGSEEHTSGEDSDESEDDEDESGSEDGERDCPSDDAESESEDGERDCLSDDDDDDTETENAVAGDIGAAVENDSGDEILGAVANSFDDPDMSCPICLNEFVGQDLGSPENCSHTFCLECIVEWSKNVNTCPIDRIEFHLICLKQEISGDVIKKIKVKVRKKEEEYVEEVTLCQVCHLGDREDRLLLCDSCDSGYHCECLDPPLEIIPIEEWFCPPCVQVMNRRALAGSGTNSSHNRLIARTSASEIVRSRIQSHRAANSEDSSSEAVHQPRNVHTPKRSTRKRKTTKRKVKRKTTHKSYKSKTSRARTKATSVTGKAKGKKSATKKPSKTRRKVKRRKTRKSKKKSKRSYLASKRLVAPSIKKRIADRLGLCEPPPGHTMPYVKKPSGQQSNLAEQLPSLDILGCRDQLFDFTNSYVDNPRPSTSKHSNKRSSSWKPAASASTSGINLLDNILENQNALLQSSKNIVIGKDGSLSVKDLPVRGKCEIKALNNKSRSETYVLEQERTKTSSSMCMTKQLSLTSSFGMEDKTDSTSPVTPLISVKREKRSPSPDSHPVCMKNIKLDHTLSISSEPPCPVKTEKKVVQPDMQFSDAKTNFETGDSADSDVSEQTKQATWLSVSLQKKGTFSFGTEDKTGNTVALVPSIQVKREKSGQSLDPLPVHVRSMKLDQGLSLSSVPSHLMKKEREHTQPCMAFDDIGTVFRMRDSRSNDSNNSAVSTLPAFKSTQKHDSHAANGKSDASTNKHRSSHKIDSDVFPKAKPLPEDHGQRNCVSLSLKDDKHSESYHRAENNRKRQQISLSNGMKHPFKIPKLSKCINGNYLDSQMVSYDMPDDYLYTQRTTKSEIVIGRGLSVKPMFNGSVCDVKPNIHKNQDALKAASASGGTVATHAGIQGSHNENNCTTSFTSCVQSSSSMLQTSQQKDDCELHTVLPSGQSNVKVKISVSSIANPLSPTNSMAVNNKCTVDDFHGTSQVKCVSLNSDNNGYCVKESPHSSASPISEVGTPEGDEQEIFLHVGKTEQLQNFKTLAEPGMQQNTRHSEHKALPKLPLNEVDKRKLKESIVAEIKKHLKDFFVTDLITKDEYKEIMRRSVPKVFQNCGKIIDSEKIRKLVVSYVHLIGNTRAGSS